MSTALPLTTPTQHGAIIAVEGFEGVGKSTQVELLAKALMHLGYSVKTPREPGGTGFGEEVRRILKNGDYKPVPKAELLMFEASRAQLIESLQEHLKGDGVLIMDRFVWSTLAYQGAGRGLDSQDIHALNAFATSGVHPDLVVFLDLTVAESRSRVKKRGIMEDNFEALHDPFFERVRNCFRRLCEEHADRSLLLDATEPISLLHVQILDRVTKVLQSKGIAPSASSC